MNQGVFVALFLTFAAGYFAGAYIRYIGFKKKIQRVRDIQYAELKKIFDLINNRSKVVTKEFNEVIEFVNTELPTDITNIVLAEPKLAILKEKGGIPDKAYLEALEPVILGVQRVVSERVMIAVTNITAETVKDIKGLIDVPKE